MGDGAREITKAGKEVFGEEGARLMCWPHTYRKIIPRLANLKKVNGKIQQELLHDIKFLQWSCHSKHTFDVVFTLLERKYLIDNKQKYTAKENDVLGEFFLYFREQWGPESHVSRWYEGAHPWGPSHNQGIEGKNKSIKKDHTFKRRCPLGTFMEIVKRMVKEWSEEDDSLLHGQRTDYLEKVGLNFLKT